jgi:hypothetical protein
VCHSLRVDGEMVARLTEGEAYMNVQETTGTTTELDNRELTATELNHVSGGQTFQEYCLDFCTTFFVRSICADGQRGNSIY